MKKTILRTITMAAVALFSSCNSTAQNPAAKEPDSDMKVLVAYYSATGTTERVAKAIAKSTGAALYEIVPETAYTAADLDWRNPQSRSSVEMNDAASRPALGGEPIDAAEYDVVFVGYPIWWDLCPRVVNTWIESQRLDGKTVIPFATSGSSTIDGSVRDLRRLYPAVNWQEGKLLNGGPTQAAAWAASLPTNDK